MTRSPLEPREGQPFLLNRLPPDVPLSHQEARLPEPASRTIKWKARFSRRTQARRLPPPSPGSCRVFRLARRARRSAPRISRAAIAPAPISMCFQRMQKLERRNPLRVKEIWVQAPSGDVQLFIELSKTALDIFKIVAVEWAEPRRKATMIDRAGLMQAR